MDQYIDAFITYLQEVKHASSNTVQAYLNDLKRLELYLRKQNITTVTKISETGLNSYVLSMEKDGLSPASVSRNIASMRAFILYLLKHGAISGDPLERMKPPKVIKKFPQIIEASFVDILLQQPNLDTRKGLRDKAMLELLYATGIKVSELITLKLSNINLNGRFITCGERERNIPFGRMAKTALEDYLNIRLEAFPDKDNPILFLNSSGGQLTRQGFWKILKAYANTAGIPNMNPNMIRRSFAAHLIDNGADLESVREFLGHTDIATTQLYIPRSYKSSREVYMNTHPRA